jgi:hypothetical protein
VTRSTGRAHGTRAAAPASSAAPAARVSRHRAQHAGAAIPVGLQRTLRRPRSRLDDDGLLIADGDPDCRAPRLEQFRTSSFQVIATAAAETRIASHAPGRTRTDPPPEPGEDCHLRFQEPLGRSRYQSRSSSPTRYMSHTGRPWDTARKSGSRSCGLRIGCLARRTTRRCSPRTHSERVTLRPSLTTWPTPAARGNSRAASPPKSLFQRYESARRAACADADARGRPPCALNSNP